MRFLETVEKARAFLERNGRVSPRALQREFDLDDRALDDLIEELVEIQRVAVRDGRALAWAGGVPPAPTETPDERDPRAYTPKHLADRILQSKSALEGERKQVTVLFADVKGSMELQEGIDPEEWHGIMDRFFGILTDGVHRFEGTVNQYLGDGIMSLFGAPIAHEDHARRACYAALHLSDELRRYGNELRLERGLSFSVRMGLNSGDVVVGKIGDDLRMDYTAQGHTVGLAARMQEIAEPGRIYLTRDVARLVEGYFVVDDLGESSIKGVREPVRVHELQGIGQLRTRLDASRARGFSRFVGRAEEMQLLETALGRADKGNPQIIGFVGEPGVGKSRLCFEFLERCRARGIMTYETTGVAHGKAIPLLPMLKLFRAFFGITEQDSDVTARERIAGRLLLLGEQFRDLLPVMFDFMGVPDPENPAPKMDPEARQRQIVSVIKGMIQARASRETQVSLLEDLHWFDSASEAYLDPLLDAPPGARSLVVVNFRPEYHADWTQRPQYQQVPLAPLGPEAIAELLADLLGNDPSLAGLPELIRERTAGNPFFMEEVVNSLVESGHLQGSRGSYRLAIPIDEIAVPDTVQAVLAARIDRLAEREKQVLQTAAVIGKTFTEPVLERAAALPASELSAALHALKTGDFIHELALYPVAEYRFKHPLTQEVALGSQLRERRARVHAAVAEAIEALNPDKLDEQAAELAYHWEEAGDALQAARWHRRAAEWIGDSDFNEALGHWHRVRELAKTLPDSPESGELGVEAGFSILNLGWRTGLGDAEARPLLDEVRAFASRSGDDVRLGDALQAFGICRLLRGEIREALEPLHEAVELARRRGDPKLVAERQVPLMEVPFCQGPLADALSLCDEVLAALEGDLEHGEEKWNVSLFIWTLALRGCRVLAYMGRLREAYRDMDRALALARQRESDEVLGWILGNYGWMARWAEDPSTSLVQAQQSIEIAEKNGSPLSLNAALNGLGQALLASGNAGAAVEIIERAVALCRERRVLVNSLPSYLAGLADAHVAGGDADAAREAADEAIALAQRIGTPVFEAEGWISRARALLASRRADARPDVEAALARVESLIKETGACSLQPLVHEQRATVAKLTGDAEACTRELREAHRLYTEIGATGHAERVARELDS